MNALLDVKQLTLFAGRKMLCRELSFSIKSGEIIGILGPNGSGKTTLLHTLAGLLPLSQGNIVLNGRNLFSLKRKDIARQIGILFQDTQDVFPQTIYEVCASGRFPHSNSLVDNAIIEQALQTMDLNHLRTQLIQTLSGGERKRLSIATLLAQTPQIYLLDEPTNHLDLHYQIKVLNHFKQCATENQAAVVMSLHDVNLAARYCNTFLLLFQDGEYVFADGMTALTQNHLQRLYQHPLQAISYGQKTFWMPHIDF